MTLRAKLNRLIAPLVAAILLLIYVPIAGKIEDNFQAEMLRSAQAVAMAIIFFTFAAKLARVFSREVPDSARRFYLGLLLWSGAASNGAGWRLVWRMAGGGPDLEWFLTNDFSLFPLWVEVVGIFFMLSGPAIPGDKLGDLTPLEPEDISWRRLLIAAVLCVSITYMVVVQRLGECVIHEVLEKLRPL